MKEFDYHGDKIRDDMLTRLERGELLFGLWCKWGIIPWSIQIVTGGDKTHLSWIVGIKTVFDDFVPRVFQNEAIGRGVTPNQFSYALKDKHVRYVDVYRLKSTDWPLKAREAYVAGWMRVNTPYGFKTIGMIFATRVGMKIVGKARLIDWATRTGMRERASRWARLAEVCSQYGAHVCLVALSIAHNEKGGDDTWFVDPERFENEFPLEHLYRIKRLEK